MKKIINLIAVLIIVNAVYSFYLVLSESGSSDFSGVWLFLTSAALYIIAGIGLLLKKNWAIALYWGALILGIVNAIQSDVNLMRLDFDTVFFIVLIIVGIFLTVQWKKLSSAEIK